MSGCQSGGSALEGPPPKKIRISDVNTVSEDHDEFNLKDFIVEKILSNNTKSKTVCILGNFEGRDGRALVILEKTAFKESDLGANGYFSDITSLELLFRNDIYTNCECFPPATSNSVKTTIICPVTDKHILKFAQQGAYIINETTQLYESVTLPHLHTDQFNLKWIQNILNGVKEADRVVYSNPDPDEGFILLPDLKWDGKTLETLYLVAIVRKSGIKSLRDLDESHLPLLRTIRDEGKKAILEKYGVLGTQLRVYIHYQPSFYHLHVHFTYLRNEAPGIFTEKSHLLDTVINNIEMIGDYYKKATLPFVLKEMDSLFSKFEEKGIVQRNNLQQLIEKTQNIPNAREIVEK